MYMTMGATAADPTTLTAFTQWAKFQNGPGSAPPVVTPNAGTAPDGAQTATRVQFVRGAGANAYSILRANLTCTPGPFTDSVYLRLAPGAAPCTIGVRSVGDVNGANDVRKLVTVTDTWARVAITNVCIGAAQTFDLLLWEPMSTSLSADVLVWNARADAGSAPLGLDYAAGNGSINPAWVLGGIAALVLLSGNRR